MASTGEYAPQAGPAGADACGWLVERGGTVMALYRELGRLWFAVDGTAWDVTDATCEVSTTGSRRTVEFVSGGALLVSTSFEDRRALEFAVLAPVDFTAADPEDFDWALFLLNTFADLGRRDRLGRPAA